MFNNLKRKWMAFKNLFDDNNNINEKSVVGFASFAIMTCFAIADLVTGYFGKDLVINEFIYDSFLFITLGCFGIAEVGKIFGAKGDSAPEPPAAPEPPKQDRPDISINIDGDDW
jgi:hypothetical protein|tara:strand:+ start:1585 stop:1926 length:342 start_codon:yes stop_codon:yes gene_type:complete